VRYLRKFHPWYIERLGEAPPVQDALQRAGTLGEQRTLIAGSRGIACSCKGFSRWNCQSRTAKGSS
jgi:hypothetical protein